MTIFYIYIYIILGILVGVPAYLLLNTVLALFARPFAGVVAYLWPDLVGSSFMNEIKGGARSLAAIFGKRAKIFGWFMLISVLYVLLCILSCRIIWLICQVLGAWFKFVKFCWNLGAAKKRLEKEKDNNKNSG